MSNSAAIIIEERKDMFILQTQDGIQTVPKTHYFVLKFKHFGGNRIFFDFGEKNARIEETYDDGIFNCHYNNHHVQISDSQGISRAVLEKDLNGYFKMFASWHGIEMQVKIIDAMLKPYERRIRKVSSGWYEIDDIFAVDTHGVAHYRTEKGDWENLCLVVKDAVEPKEMDLPAIGPTILNEITQTILAKILFLLFPTNDSIVMRQLPNYAKRHIEHLIKTNEGSV